MSTFVLPLADPNATLENVGGKGMSLAKMARAGLLSLWKESLMPARLRNLRMLRSMTILLSEPATKLKLHLTALVFAVPALSINWRTAPETKTVLKTDGVYGVVRNPIYLADILFTLGFAVMFRSIIGIALVPIWWLAYLSLVLVEEASLERALGQRYLDYKARVKGRILPGLPL